MDDADAFERDVEGGGGFFDRAAFAEKDGDTEAKGVELAGGLEDARFGAFGEYDPLGMTLELLDDAADESHSD